MFSADEFLRRSDERADVDAVDRSVPPGLLVLLLRDGERGLEEHQFSELADGLSALSSLYELVRCASAISDEVTSYD